MGATGLRLRPLLPGDEAAFRAAHEAIPHCRFETLPRAAHFPHLEDPEGLATTLADFLATTAPVRIDDSEWAAVIAQQAKRRLRAVA